jgi:hypothetical protein
VQMTYAPNRAGAGRERKRLVKLDVNGSRTDAPNVLSLSDIHVSDGLFQPRFDSIAYAPGRSEAHIADLTRPVKAGGDLDALTVAAFGNDWYLLDGHHRLAAYRAGGRTEPVPVRALTTDLRGTARIAWAVEASFADNKKSTLNISSADKADGAWRAVAGGEGGSKSDTAAKYGVSSSLIANMRRTKAALEACEADPEPLHSWRRAQAELARLESGKDTQADNDFAERQRRDLARRLKAVMHLRVSPGELAAALEEYEPGIVSAMSMSRMEREDDA